MQLDVRFTFCIETRPSSWNKISILGMISWEPIVSEFTLLFPSGMIHSMVLARFGLSVGDIPAVELGS